MAIPFLNHAENSLNLQKIKKKPNKYSNLNSLWAFLLSIFIYISVFYVFNLSPSTLLCTTKFWFIISNTLILIIAADFDGFSSSKQQHDFVDEYGNNINARAKSRTRPSFEMIQYVRIDEKTMPKYHHSQEVVNEEPHEKIINMVAAAAAAADHHTEATQQNVSNKPEEIFPAHEINDKLKEKHEKIEYSVVDKVKKKRRGRTLSAVGREKEGKMVLQRTLSERRHDDEERMLEENEFSRMSNEELNRRVEEFILRCNRQIRNEAVSNNRRQGRSLVVT